MRRRALHTPSALASGWAAYLRTSDENVQAPERSQAYQMRLISERLIEPSGLPVIETYADTLSGKTTQRANLQRMLADARRGKFSHLGIAFTDRFGRNDVEGLGLFDELIKLGIKIRIAMYPSLEPEKSDARMMLGVMMGMARFESARTSERCREGMFETLHRGDWAWKAPDGYLNAEIRKSHIDPGERGKHARHKHTIATNPERFQIWREAFEMLLTDRYTLAEIAEALHAKGYRLPRGGPFVKVHSNGVRKPVVKMLSEIFHNWFYAGWVVTDSSWACIPPKTVRGNWEPMVSTEDFERGLRILAERNVHKRHKPKHLYLLQGLVYLQKADGTLVKLLCQTPNAGRQNGGVPYYYTLITNDFFLCHAIDDQVAAFMHDIQVEARFLPAIRAAYATELQQQLGPTTQDEKERLQKLLRTADEEELRAARLYASGKLSEAVWDTMVVEWREQRLQLTASLENLMQSQESYLASLDEALALISKTGVLFDKLAPAGQRELLQHLVKKILISPEGQIVKLELHSPFAYLHTLAQREGGSAPSDDDTPSARGKDKNSRRQSASSRCDALCVPGGNRTLAFGSGGRRSIR